MQNTYDFIGPDLTEEQQEQRSIDGNTEFEELIQHKKYVEILSDLA